MFEAYTSDALLADVLANAPEGLDTRKGSIFYDAVAGVVEKIAKMYTDLDQVFEYVFVSTAAGEYLDLRAAEYGLERLNATSAKYYLTYSGTAPAENTRFFHNDTGLYFYVGTVGQTYIIIAEEAGTGSNEIAQGDLAVPVTTISGLTSSTFGDVYEYGTDEESDDDLRTRILEKINGPAENGNKQHYKTWCESIDGVGLARIYPLWNGENTVKAVLVDSTGNPLSSAKVAEVQEYIDPADKGYTAVVDGRTYTVGDGLGNGVANIGAHFTAASADTLEITVSFTAELAGGYSKTDAQAEAQEQIAAYFTQLALSSDDEENVVVRISAVGAILSGMESIVDYSKLRINSSAINIALDEDSVPVLKEVVVSTEVVVS